MNDILTFKLYCLTCQTLVFGVWNNIVWRPKQYCFIRRTLVFYTLNTLFRITKHSLVPFTSILSTSRAFSNVWFSKAITLFLAFIRTSFERTGMPYATKHQGEVSLCISRIAREWQFLPPAPGWMRRRPSQAIRLTFWHFDNLYQPGDSRCLIRRTLCNCNRSKLKVYETALSPSNVLFRHKKDTWHRTAKPIPFSASSRHKAFL